MRRSRQHAMMFLLGALLVGGVIGYSAAGAVRDNPQHPWSTRFRMYEDLRLSAEQQREMDSVAKESAKAVEQATAPIQTTLDSIRAAARGAYHRILTSEQWAELVARQAKAKQHFDSLNQVGRKPAGGLH